ncbi:hypothetical protein [Oceanicoccus sp. KOV_DT_Chl]|uniref:hypothetical protein n=1 Tax=Oceanicoccus sp. KOV_DT_Chl TaxID=1904639 RepID=UPI000C7D91E0|nr:hypothetical protein [Oceanicoccus sp. KOV_DT_Chl]
MKTNRREFISISTTAAFAMGSGVAVAASKTLSPNEQALAKLASTPYASSAMPDMFSSLVDATGFENHRK